MNYTDFLTIPADALAKPQLSAVVYSPQFDILKDATTSLSGNPDSFLESVISKTFPLVMSVQYLQEIRK